MSPGYMCRAVLQHFLVGSPVADIPIIGTALARLLDAAVLSSDFALGSSVAKCRRRPRAPLIGTSARAAWHTGELCWFPDVILSETKDLSRNSFCPLCPAVRAGVPMREYMRTPGEPPTTASGRSFVGSEVNRNERAPQCGVATIEVAGRAINKPKAKFEFSIRCVRIRSGSVSRSGIPATGLPTSTQQETLFTGK